MTASIVLLSGPPGAGKDTVTAALTAADPRFALFEKLKVGTGRSVGYRMMDPSEYERLEAAGEILQSHERYRNLYAVDKPRLRAMEEAGLIPVIHVGRRRNLKALRSDPARWSTTSVLLWVSREICAERLRSRGMGDLDARLAAYDEELRDVRSPDAADDYDLVLNTSELSPAAVAERIIVALEKPAQRQRTWVRSAIAEITAA